MSGLLKSTAWLRFAISAAAVAAWLVAPTLTPTHSVANIGVTSVSAHGFDASSPIAIHAGSPFFEVAQYRERWFLRDGYHRAYSLLRAGVFRLPAVIVQARTLEELGATRPWFFPEEVLFSPTPPRVTDFLDDELVLEYDRIPLIKTLRVTVEEAFVPAVSSGENK